MVLCWYAAVGDLQDELDERVAAARKVTTTNAALAELVAGQRAWEAKRNSDCSIWERKYPGGSLATLSIAICRYQAGRQRLADIKVANAAR